MKLGKIIFLVGLLAITASCADKKKGEQKDSLFSNFVSITENEDKGVKEILECYDGQCKYAIGTNISTEDGKTKYFKLEMSQSEVIEDYSDMAEMPASNVAYLFYRNLQEERNNYDEIHTVLKFSDGDEMNFKYSVEQLEIVKGRMPTVEKVVALIKEKKFNEIKAFLNDTSVAKYDKNELVANMEKADQVFGDVKEFMPYGFRLNENQDGKRYLHISGIIFREKQNQQFSADFDLSAPKEELLMVAYKL